MLKLSSKVVKIVLNDITRIELRKGWFSYSIIVRVNRLEALRQVPGSKAGELRLKIARKDVSAAGDLVASAQMASASTAIKKMVENSKQPATS